MAKYGQSSGFIFVGGIDLSGDQTVSLSDEVEELQDQVDGLGDSWEEHCPIGLARTTVEAKGGIYDDSSGQITAFQEKGETKQLMVYGFEGTAIGDHCVILNGTYAVKWKRISDRAALIRAEAEHVITGRHGEAVLLHGPTAETSDGDTESSSVDRNSDRLVPATAITSSSAASPTNILCASAHGLITGDEVVIAGHSGSTPDINGQEVVTVVDSLNFTVAQNVTVGGTGGTIKKVTSTGCAGHLHVSALTLGGYTDVTVLVTDSDDDITYSTLLTFTNFNTAPTSEEKTIATEVQRYLACDWTFNGAGSGQSVTPIVAVSRY